MDAAPPLPALEVASAAFFHVECSHPRLFHTEYKRSNRTKVLKILRCFPHCCPEHIDRSYCGTSLSVRVELRYGQSYTLPPRTLLASEIIAVFARFEAVSDTSLRPGECIDFARVTANTQSEKNLGGQWVAGALERPSRLVKTIRAQGTPSDVQKPLVFHLNSKPLSHWCYDWESGANKAHRLMKHVLKAYVVERCAVDEDGNFTAFTGHHARTQLYRVLHVVASPEFTVISYRRAPSQPAVLSARTIHASGEHGSFAYAESSYHPLAHSQNSYISDSTSAHFQPMTVKSEPLDSEIYGDKRPQTSLHSSPLYCPTESSTVLLEDRLKWEYANLPIVSVSRDMALVYAFLRWTPLSAYASFVGEAMHLVRQSLKESLREASSEISLLNCFSRLLFDQANPNGETGGISTFFVEDETKSTSTSMQLPKELETLLRALSQVTQWWFSKDTRQWVHAFFLQNAGSVLDKHAMRACFLLFVQELQDRLDTQIFVHTGLNTLANAADEVISTVYAYPYFQARRLQVREILRGQNFAGWNAFVAQMRETYISKSAELGISRELSRPHNITFDLAHPPRNDIERDWNGQWLLDVDGAAWEFSDQAIKADKRDGYAMTRTTSDAKCVISFLNVFEIISQLVRLEVAIDVQGYTLYVRSTQGVANPLGCMRIVLDKKERVFSQFPNGLASATNAGAHGNYIGEIRVERPERLVAYLQVFSWSTLEDEPSYNVRIRIECERSSCLCVIGDVLITTAQESFTPEEALSLGEMSLRTKRETVANAHVKQLRRENSTGARSVAATAWKELGKFRLSYTKV